MHVLFISAFVYTGCFSKWEAVDSDGDGLTPLDGDCWDASNSPPQVEGAMEHNLGPGDIYFGAEDAPYDGIDANCDGSDDFDVDGDGYVPSEYFAIQTYGLSNTGAGLDGDCWDDPNVLQESLNGFEAIGPEDVHAGAFERWYDGIDQNCDALSDFDQDSDNQDSSEYDGTDCNDLDSEVFEGAEELFYDGVDQDCLGGDDCDADGDGYPSSADGVANDICSEVQDCDDSNADVFPDPEINEIFYNGLDDDCNPQTGDGDADADGFWAEDYEDIMASSGVPALEDPNGLERDCWDADETAEDFTVPDSFTAQNNFEQLSPSDVYPLADDRPYDNIDADCQQDTDFDADGDGYETSLYGVGDDCFDSPEQEPNWFSLGIQPQNVNISNTENWYNGVDEDCSGTSDYDQDGDGFDSIDHFNLDSGQPGTDCDDTEPSTYPNAPEIVDDHIDQDCADGDLCFVDADSDGYRNLDISLVIVSTDLDCEDPGEGSISEQPSDCDDLEPTSYPTAPEVFSDGVDQDCDGLESCFIDADSDGFRHIDTTLSVGSTDLDCSDLGEGAQSEPANDCDDGDPDTFPGAAEIDSNTLCMRDTDQDGYGDSVTSLGIDSGTDCDDSNELINISIQEDVDNGVDQDCDSFEHCYVDFDSDNFRNSDEQLRVNSSDLDCDDPGEGTASESPTDCDDNEATTYPGAPEIVSDGVDQDCDDNEACFLDADSDGYRNIDTSLTTSSLDLDCDDDGEGDITEAATDCDDLVATTHPNAFEEVDDGIDQDCVDGDVCYQDVDSDGFRALDTLLRVVSSDLDCDDPGEGSTSESPTDCDDNEATTFPGASEVIDDSVDQDCANGDVCYVDADTDGFRNVNTALTVVSSDLDCNDPGEGSSNELPTDCVDTNASIYPGAPETFDDGVDQDCANGDSCYLDADSDGFRHLNQSLSVVSSDLDCNDPGEGTLSEPATDCDDGDQSIFPGAPESIDDGVDQDCSNGDLCFVDADTDGFRNINTALTVVSSDLDCNDPGEGSSSESPSDCDDSENSIYPGATEVLSDGIDQDCAQGDVCYLDFDSDGFRNTDTTQTVVSSDLDCNDSGEGSSLEPATDCDDTNANINPSKVDIIDDGVDQDCSGGDSCFVDQDSDGFRNINTALSIVSIDLDCEDSGEGSTSEPATDCDDNESTTFPGAVELIDDGVDQDCSQGDVCYVDADSDGYRNQNTSLIVVSNDLDCEDFGEGELVEPSTDCNDSVPSIYPSAFELVDDGVDQDCFQGDVCYRDSDSDSFRSIDTSLRVVSSDLDCNDVGEGKTAEPSTDCDDTEASIFPGASEVPDDGVDQDCAQGDVCYVDGDSDGFRNPDTSLRVNSIDLDCEDPGEGSTSEPSTDCDDTQATTFPGAPEVPDDGVDQDCSQGDVCYVDSDSDGFRNTDTTQTVISNDLDCEDLGEGSSSEPASDCDDSNSLIHPNGTEIVDDGIDQDCSAGDLCYVDEDSDGFRNSNTALRVVSLDLDCNDFGEGSSAEPTSDCDDTVATTYPGAVEFVDDGVDQDCLNGDVCYVDFDNDGYRTIDDTQTIVSSDLDCNDNGEGLTSEPASDCNDNNTNVSPGEIEIVDDGIDQNCTLGDSCYVDFDSDNFRHTDTNLRVNSVDLDCDDSGEGSTSEPATDCDDTEETTYPGAVEDIDDGVDQDCFQGDMCYVDLDSDAFRNTNTSLTVVSSDLDCNDSGEGSTSEPATDCNDSISTINPSVTDTVDDGIDQSCSGGDSCYTDGDLDGQRNSNTSVRIDSLDLDCNDSGEASSSDSPLDCDDGNALIYHGAIELIDDGVDQDCDTEELCYLDLDSDGFRNQDVGILVASSDLDCQDSGEGASVEPPTDCNDSDALIFPNANEDVANGVDQDCDTFELCFEDLDGDLYGSTNTSTSSDLTCLSSGFSDVSTDCDDSDIDTYPGSAERESTVDCMRDNDNDGYGDASALTPVVAGLDCLDDLSIDTNAASFYPFADEFINDGFDNNCDGLEALGIECEGIQYDFPSSLSAYYLGCDDSTDWDSADITCVDAGYDGLVRIGSLEESDAVLDVFDLAGLNSNYWIGLSDAAIEGTFVWISDQSETVVWLGNVSGSSPNGLYTNWNGSEPSSSNSGEDCVEVYGLGSGPPATVGAWNDATCSINRNYACMYEF